MSVLWDVDMRRHRVRNTIRARVERDRYGVRVECLDCMNDYSLVDQDWEQAMRVYMAHVEHAHGFSHPLEIDATALSERNPV